MDGSIIAAVTVDYRHFQKNLLLALIEAKALSKEQAASVCTATAEDIRNEPINGPAGNALAHTLARQNEDIASLILTGVKMAR